ncbi:MAG: hypothetical protein KDD36_01595 [Flavobacteriales bacterium]|nr:hypothetical protein [Flavobacteriales bacterium]
MRNILILVAIYLVYRIIANSLRRRQTNPADTISTPPPGQANRTEKYSNKGEYVDYEEVE